MSPVASAYRSIATAAAALALGAFIAAAAPVLASEAASGAGGHDTWLGLPRWIWLTANLLLFLYLIYRFAGRPIARLLDARAIQIREDLERARTQEKEAAEVRGGLEAKVATLEREMNELIERAKSEGEKERAEILAQAERERERLLAQTRDEIALRLAQARKELTAYTATLAADLAKERLEQELTPEDRQRLFESNLKRLERAPAAGSDPAEKGVPS